MECFLCESDLDGNFFWCNSCQESFFRSNNEDYVSRMIKDFGIDKILFGKKTLYEIGDIICLNNKMGIVLDIDGNFYKIKFRNGETRTVSDFLLRKTNKEILKEYLKEMNFKIEDENFIKSLVALVELARNKYDNKINSGIDLVNFCFNHI